MADGRVEFEITADGRKAFASIDQVTDALEKAGKEWEGDANKSTDKIGGSFTSMVKGIVGAISAAKIGQMLLNIGKDAVQAASDLEEVQNVVDVTFGDAGAVKIEKWAKTAGDKFGLTETQAKKFSSTLGAMMKSAGMTGDEIVQMSTDLSGLAADMASFYNLDFDTAFQKIRSGISGETEPLKQLGINMSEVNLNAYAMANGIEKSFSEMSQGEKTMLRYKYLLEATSDAQGDFERTSDGFANATRKMETNIESLKTNLGKILLPVVNDVVGAINSMFDSLTQEKKQTVLDDFAAIDLKTAEKVAGIEATADKARTLTSVLEGINEKAAKSGASLSKMDENAPDGSSLSGLVGKLEDIETKAGDDKTAIKDIAKDGLKGTEANGLIGKLEEIESKAKTGKTAVGSIADKTPDGSKFYAILESLDSVGTKAADNKTAIGKMADDEPDTSKPAKLESTLDNISNKAVKSKKAIGEVAKDAPDGTGNIQKLSKKIGEIAETATESKEAIAKIADGASKASESVTKIATDSVTAQEAVTNIEKGATAAQNAVEDLADPTARTAEENALWLETCKELVNTIPGLSSIINTQTGEIKGGTKAVNDYIDAWEKGQKYLAMKSAHQQKQAALETKFSELPTLELDKTVAEYRVKQQQKVIQEMADSMGIEVDFGKLMKVGGTYESMWTPDERALNEAIDKYYKLNNAAATARDTYNEQKAAYDEAVAAFAEEGEAIDETYGNAIETAGEWTEAQKESAKQAITAFGEALAAVEDYYNTVRKETASDVNGTLKGFNRVKTVAETYKEAMKDADEAQKQLEELKKFFGEGIEINIETAGAHKQIKDMIEGLQSQLDFINQYQKDLATAREKGLSEEMLAFLSDGSEQSAAYLNAIAGADKTQIEELNKLYAEVNKNKESFTDELTKQKLAIDEQYKGLIESAKQAAKDLNVANETQQATANNIQGIALGIRKKLPEVQTEVDAVLAQLNRLNEWGVDIDYGNGKSTVIKPRSSTLKNGASAIPQLAVGMDWIPFDGFLASLHEGEAVLTAEENRVWQQFKNNQRGVDYDALGGVMRDSIKPGGDVYLEGRVVGQVISQMQGNQYRTMQRSGWQQ